jgi:hypothetical protein
MTQKVNNQFLPRLMLLRQHETEGTKACNKCERVLPLTCFYSNVREYKGVSGHCKDCHKKYKDSRKQRERDLRLTRKYGLNNDEYQRLAAIQNHRCAICGTDDSGHPSSSDLIVDHDHITGCVRGLLCSSCNVAIGHFRDNVSLLLGAIGYLTDPPANGVISYACKQDAKSTHQTELVQSET